MSTSDSKITRDGSLTTADLRKQKNELFATMDNLDDVIDYAEAITTTKNEYGRAVMLMCIAVNTMLEQIAGFYDYEEEEENS
jgi:hypothetical protein